MKIFFNYLSQSVVQKILILIIMSLFVTLTHAGESQEKGTCIKSKKHAIQAKKQSRQLASKDSKKINLFTQNNSFQVLSYDYNAEGKPEIVKAE
ncbi:hypothetical protein N9N67_01760 [Bacteriovoracaceae bacterium]|nr:hypothetical protein [Bacteriovoracaceae bacterium]